MAPLNEFPPAVMQLITDAGFVCSLLTARFSSPTHVMLAPMSNFGCWSGWLDLYEHLSDKVFSKCPEPR